ncbi:serine protease gd-like isoform X1 [Athalia rosae]|uniref:serine protease gd-like isoform X1 n=2 Tax=Athalia rosae TaxID=37344 RepID=UPI00203326FA|nr:serine protease gd-like isoform X1 [Athalia rosae]
MYFRMFRIHLVVVGLCLLIELIGIGLGQLQSPCPQIFRYVRDDRTGEIQALLEIHGVQQGVALHVMLELSIAAALPTQYVGKIELESPKDQSVEAIRQGRPLVYRVYFPIQKPVPLVMTVIFNNREYCSGSRAIGSIVTSVTLKHSLFPPGVTLDSSNSGGSVQTSPYYPGPVTNQRYPGSDTDSYSKPSAASYPSYPEPSHTSWNVPQTTPSYTSYPKPTSSADYPKPAVHPTYSKPTQRPVNRPISTPPSQTDIGPAIGGPPSQANPFITPSQDSGVFNDCGRPKKYEVNLLVSRGDKTEPGDWPWLVALFVSRIRLEFQCAGNLITDKHVLTAAHCLKSDGKELPASTLLAVVGRYRLRNWAERGSVTYEVSQFILHSEYGQRGKGFDCDIGVVTLMESVTFGKLIKPICLWSGSTEIETVVGKVGFVVGWGRDELGNPVTVEPRMAKVPIVSQEECLRSNADFVEITSNRTFCGGSRDGSGPCNGDSGGGLVMWDATSRRYHLRGLVSLSLLDRETGACDLSQFVVYTDTARYLDWIYQQISS